MIEKLRIDFRQPIPLFPLPNCVLLPHATVPLHIFEERYCRMIHDVLDSHGLIAMALFKGDGWKENSPGKPSIRRHVCVGYILRHQELWDNRYDLLLQGVCRARIVEEVPSEPYRKVLLVPTESNPPREVDFAEDRQQVESLLADPLLKQLASVSAIRNWLSAEIPTAAMVDLAIMTVCCSAEERYTMLAEPDSHVRLSWLAKHLQDTRHTLTVAERYRPPELKDGVHLN
jgi:Lon protease-like protein